MKAKPERLVYEVTEDRFSLSSVDVDSSGSRSASAKSFVDALGRSSSGEQTASGKPSRNALAIVL